MGSPPRAELRGLRSRWQVLLEPGQESLPSFLAEHRVDVVASLPSYEPSQTDRPAAPEGADGEMDPGPPPQKGGEGSFPSGFPKSGNGYSQEHMHV